MRPMAAAMVAEGVPFHGVLYGGLMKTPEGVKVIEFNARFGDPETEVILPRIASDIYDIFSTVAAGGSECEVKWSDKAVVGVVLASKGYPGDYAKGFEIGGLEKLEGARVYHMGTARRDAKLQTAGGRVMIVVAEGDDASEARKVVYRNIEQIECDNLFYRKDIGKKYI